MLVWPCLLQHPEQGHVAPWAIWNDGSGGGEGNRMSTPLAALPAVQHRSVQYSPPVDTHIITIISLRNHHIISYTQDQPHMHSEITVHI